MAMRWWQWHAVPVILAMATISCSAPSSPASTAGTPVPVTPAAQSTIPARATTAVAVAAAGPTQTPASGAPVRPTVADTSFKGGPLPTARAGAFGEPTAVPIPTRVVGIAKVPLKEVVVGMWCTNAEQSITGSTMQCLALTAEGIFSLGVVVDGNVYSQSVVSPGGSPFTRTDDRQPRNRRPPGGPRRPGSDRHLSEKQEEPSHKFSGQDCAKRDIQETGGRHHGPYPSGQMHRNAQCKREDQPDTHSHPEEP